MTISLDGLEDSLSALRAVLSDRAWNSLCWYTPYVRPSLYDAAELVSALRRRVVEQPRVQCRLLLPKALEWQRDCSRLVALIERLSALELRALPASEPRDRPEFSQAFLIVDDQALLHWTDPRRCIGYYAEQGGGRTRELAAFFAENWPKSQPEAEVRALRL